MIILPDEIIYMIVEFFNIRDLFNLNRLKPKNNENKIYIFTLIHNKILKIMKKTTPLYNNIFNYDECIFLTVNIKNHVVNNDFQYFMFKLCDSLVHKPFIIIKTHVNFIISLYRKNKNKIILVYELKNKNAIYQITMWRQNNKKDYGKLFNGNEDISREEFIKRLFYL